MKKLAFVMPWFLPMPPVRGGAVETLVDSLLRENERTGRYQITVFSREDELARVAYANYRMTEFVPVRVPQWQHKAAGFFKRVVGKVFRIGCTPGLAYLLAVQRAMKGRCFDRVIVQNQAPFVGPLSRLGVGPVDLHMHNIAIRGEQPNMQRTASYCRRLIGVSDYISDWMKENLGGTDATNRVLLNCIDVPRFAAARNQRDAMREKLGVRANEIVFLYTGRICAEKGALELAKAFVLADIPDSRLVFVGSTWFGGSQESDYQRSVRETLEPAKERVLFTGYIDYKDMPQYYALADVAVLPSIWDEPSGLTVLEAQAAGVPLISTLSGGIPQNVAPDGGFLLERGKGLVERIAEHMKKLAHDPLLRDQMSQAAMKWSQTRNEEAFFKGFCELMEEE